MLGNARMRGGGSGGAGWAALPMVLVAGALAYLATQGTIEALAAVVVALYLTLLLVLGATRLGVLTLMGCFLTAPAYKGLAGAGSTVTPTDALLVVGFALLLPRVLSGRMRLPAPYVIGGSIVAMSGLVATIGASSLIVSALGVTFWLFVMMAVPVAVNLWHPSTQVIRLFAWSYIAGQLLSWVIGRVLGHVTGGRDYGLTNHPNYFAEAGLMCVALLIYLYFSYTGWRARLVVLMFGVLCAGSVLASGSRAAPLVMAVLVLMIPIVERSAITGFVWALGGAAIVGLSPLVLNLLGKTSSVSRLLGHGTAQGSDQAREQGLQTGLQMVREKPVFGRGLVTTELFNIHNNYLEVAVAVGAIGLVGYLLVLFSFARPLFENHPHRRLCYLVWAYIGWGATVPALYDRSIWVPLALSAVVWIKPSPDDGSEEKERPASEVLAAPVAVPGRG